MNMNIESSVCVHRVCLKESIWTTHVGRHGRQKVSINECNRNESNGGPPTCLVVCGGIERDVLLCYLLLFIGIFFLSHCHRLEKNSDLNFYVCNKEVYVARNGVTGAPSWRQAWG